MESLTNNTIQPLAIGQLWSGISEFRNNTVTIAVNLITTKNCIVTVSQATDNVNFVFTDNFAHDVAIIGTQSRFQVSAKAQFMKVSVLNDSGEEIPQIVVTTYFNDVNIDSTLEQPVIVAGSVNVLNSMKATDYEFNTLRNVACDDTGHLLVNINTPITSTGDLIVNGSSSSATRHVYLMIVNTWYRVASVGNTPGHVWNSIGAIVGSENIPTVGRLFKCLSVPGNIEGQGTVYDVEYSDNITATPVGTQDVNIVSTVTIPVSGTLSIDNFPGYQPSIEVSNFPTTQPISGSVALLPAVDPTLTLGTVRLNDAYGSPLVTTAGNLMVGINNIYTVNPLHTIVDSGSITTYENPSFIISFDSGNSVRNIKTSAGSLQSLSLVNDNNALAFVALYNELAINVTTGTTVPIAVIVIQKDQAIQLTTHNLAFSTAISFFSATTYNGSTALANVYVTASYDS
jgi:hypothetical protein